MNAVKATILAKQEEISVGAYLTREEGGSTETVHQRHTHTYQVNMSGMQAWWVCPGVGLGFVHVSRE